MEKYIIYTNDLKFKNLRNIDPLKVNWDNEKVKDCYYTKNFDTVGYRLKECKNNNFYYLDLSHLNLSVFPDISKYKYYENVTKIKYLFICNNNLKECDSFLKLFDNLEVLDISYNNIEKIYFLPAKLNEFVCNNNKLVIIPSHELVNKIDCSYNNLVLLPNYPKLIDFLCNDNKIENITTYSNINRIVCKQNPIINIEYQPKMNYLDCSNTNLIGQFSNMPNLKYLICNHTKINDIANLNSLISLEIYDCSINKIPYIATLKDLLYQNTQNILLSSKYKILTHIDEHDNSFIKFI